MAKSRSEYNAKYWASHKEEISEKRKKRYKEHKEIVDATNRKWLDKNRDRWNTYMRDYRAKKRLERDKKV